MIKKTILISILFFNILNATTLETSKIEYTTNENIIIDFSDMIGQNKDWIGIYPKNTNNSWKNVVKWAWTGDIINGQIKIKGLTTGHYEARAFYNNSYRLEAIKAFKVVEEEDEQLNLKSLGANYSQGHLTIELQPIKLAPFNFNPKDWVGIYKKDASNKWKNVIKWAWAKNFNGLQDLPDGSMHFTFHNINLASGEYEVRYFLNNSFRTYKSKAFTVRYDDNHNLSYIEINNFEEDFKVLLYPYFDDDGISFVGSKDWIGLYKKDASNAWGNVIKWAWVDDMELEPHQVRSANFGQLDLALGEYEVRYFQKNSYETYKSTSFKINQ